MRAFLLLAACAAMSIPLNAQPVRPAPAAGDASPAKAAAPADTPVEAGEGRSVALKLADELVRSFVYAEQAQSYAAMLKKNAAGGRYDSGTRGEIAHRMTDDLMAVHKDGHLSVNVSDPLDRQSGGGGGGPKLPPLIQSAKTIAPGIAYIRFSAFLGTDEEMAALRKWLAENRDAKTLIFDLRNHHGGGLAEQDAIFSYLYAKPTPLARLAMAKSVYDEHGMPFPNSSSVSLSTEGDKIVATHSAVPGEKTALREAKVYLLVSNRTASAAEHFALALKSTGRATLIGEATAGANHFGGPADLNEHFHVWMPVGRTYDINTGKDWEGSGIVPDIEADPKQALVLALEKAGLGQAEAERLNSMEIPAEPIHSDKVRAR
jgi:hypothetical protein